MQTVPLHAKRFGSGFPVITLHGLFGSWENLGQVVRHLSERFEVHALDLRNHGRSPHSDDFNYPLHAADVLAYMDREGIERAHVLGHSMGGKAAMRVALDAPERVEQLVVVDIAPRSYTRNHDDVIRGLEAIDLPSLTSRQQADAQLQAYVTTPAIRSFLLKNLTRDEHGGMRWRLNLPVIVEHYDDIALWPAHSGQFNGNTLFIRGELSAYIQAEDRAPILQAFPKAQSKTVGGADHWPHAAKPQVFNKLVGDFLR